MPTIRLPANGWHPRAYQEPAWKALHSGKKRAVLVWHRRSGKDDLCLRYLSMAAFERIGSYYYLLPEASQARKAIFDAVDPNTGHRRIDDAFPHSLRSATREQDMLIRFVNGSTFQVLGSDNYNSLMGSPPVGVVFSEWSLADPRAWPFIRPILAENGGWAIFNGTPRGKNHHYHLLKQAQANPDTWFSQVLPATETSVFTEAQLHEEREGYIAEHGLDDGEALYSQEYLCSFEAALVGAYYRDECGSIERTGRRRAVHVEPNLPVHTAWDLGGGGLSGATSIWFIQIVGNEVRLVDYHGSNGHGLPYYAKLLKEKPYTYGSHLWPHDGEHPAFVDDGTRAQVAENLGIKPIVIPKGVLADGIQATRDLLARVVIDKERCNDGWEGLTNYQREWDARLKVFRNAPRKDWASHPADALRTLATGENFIEGPASRAFLKPLDYSAINKMIV